MSRFLYSSSTFKAYDVCPKSFELMQTGAPRGKAAENLTFGNAFHRVMELYIDHCIAKNRHSDISVLPEIVSRAVRETSLPLSWYDELYLLTQQFLAVYRIDLEHSVAREGAIAFDDELRVIEWSDALEYENLSHPVEQKGRAFYRMKLDEVLVFPEEKRLRIVDFKSDIYLPPKTVIEDPRSRFNQQARKYAWGAHRALFPAEIIEVEFIFTRHIFHGRPVSRVLTFSPAEIDQEQEILLAKAQYIEATDEFLAIPGDHCNLCPFRETVCPVRDQIRLEDPGDRMRRYLFLTVEREHLREQLKADVAEYGFDGELGPLRAEFELEERLAPDMERLWLALQAEGIDHPWALMTLSKTDAKRILDKDQFDRIIAAAYHAEPGTRFNVHQKKDELVALAESRGIDPTGLKVSELALAIAKSVEDAPLQVDFETIEEIAAS